MFLFRPSDKAKSNQKDFSYQPNQQNAIKSKEKSIVPQLDKSTFMYGTQQLSPIKPNQMRKRIKEKIAKENSLNLDEAEEHSSKYCLFDWTLLDFASSLGLAFVTSSLR